MNFDGVDFHPVIHLPDVYDIRDFTTLDNANRLPTHPYSIGKYDENRVGMYVHELFEGQRTVHVGIDIGAPVHTPVYAFWEGRIHRLGYNDAPGDYGHVIVTEHVVNGVQFWALFGHLSAKSIVGKSEGDWIQRGECLAWLGPEEDNGGWPVHLHFQLSLRAPETHDMPGVVTLEDREAALQLYPDPRLILGPIYP